MTVLAFDTATTRTAVGACSAGAWATRTTSEGHAAQTTLALAEAVLAEVGATPQQLSRIVVGCGPGSFTALRIGIATALGLAAAADCPLEGASTLEALRIGAGGGSEVVAIIDARRGEVFAAGPGIPAAAYAPAALAAMIAPGTLAVGDGAVLCRAGLETIGACVPEDDDPRHGPQPAALAVAATAQPLPAVAMYLRAPDAVPVAAR